MQITVSGSRCTDPTLDGAPNKKINYAIHVALDEIIIINVQYSW